MTTCRFALPIVLYAIFGSQAVDAKDASVDFAREVLPILSNKCFVCHGPDTREDVELRLDSFEHATASLGDYRAIDPQEPEKSELLARINSTDDPMPPEDAEKQLTDAERAILNRWVRQGGTYAKHWAFVPPVKIDPNVAKGSQGGTDDRAQTNAIDAFIQIGFQSRGVAFAELADRTTLARRAALILTGLPPEPDQLVAHLKDDRPGSFDRFVEDLMASPRFGEHQARYWLDAVRYGDTHGLHLDNRRGIYPYRDWVVRAFNENLPLDKFIQYQLAGDLLPNPTLAQLVATGFVRMNPSTAEGGAIPAEFQAKNNFDRTETLGTVLLGMSLTCARCHTHKYDPIPQTEYYRLLAFFNSTAENSMDGNAYEYGPVVKAPGDQAGWDDWIKLEHERETLLQEVAEAKVDLTESDAKPWSESRAADQLALVAKTDGPFAETEFQKQAEDLAGRINEAQKSFTTTLVAQDLEKPRPTHVLQRGEYNLPVGDPVEPGTLAVMGVLPKDAPQNRMGLAQWLTSREHPLVARVLINRIWQRVFGYGLVRTPEDFGLQGEQPTHPELLDWLAVELQESGWDLKHMLRMMVTSRTFRQSSAWRTDVDDPENRLFTRNLSYRLDAEVIRDIGLWSSGLLEPHMGGEGVKPYQPSGMWMALAHPGSNTKKYEPDKGHRLYRRSLYVYWKRTSPHPMMTLFDAPDRESSCVRRSRTNTSLQSLGLLNETQRIEMARKFAERLLHEYDNNEARLERIFKLLACRQPSTVESDACLSLLKQMQDRYSSAKQDAIDLLSTGEAPRDESIDVVPYAAWTQVCITILASDIAILIY